MTTNQKRAEKWLAAGVNAGMVKAILDHATRMRSDGRCERTVESYSWEVGQLALACPRKAPNDYKRKHLSGYMAARRLRLADASYKMSVIALRAFFKWARGGKSPARDLEVPGKIAPVRARRSLTRQQCDDLLACFDTSTRSGVRDVAIMALMLDTAFRASEVVALAVSGVDLESRRAEVRCKGGELGRGKYSETTRAMLVRWLSHRDLIVQPGVGALFVSVWHGEPLTVTGLYKLCRRAALRAGLPGLAPHDLRRTFAHEVLRSGAPERIALEGGRWRSLRVFHEHYTRDISIDDIDDFLPTRRLISG